MKHLIIYHAHCNDGFGAAWAAWRALKETGLVELHAASYGKEPPYEKINAGINVHIVDFSYPPHQFLNLCSMAKHVTMLDHHKTAIESYAIYGNEDFGSNVKIVFDTAMSGAMLAWNHYHPNRQPPRIIEHIQDRDLWKFILPDTKAVHLNLNTIPKELLLWNDLILKTDASGFEFKAFVAGGQAIQRYYENAIKNLQATQKRVCTFDGKRGFSCNAPGLFASDLGHELANESGTYGLTWEVLADGRVKGSLRSNGDYDVSSMALKYGGGGHKNAAGFVCELVDIISWHMGI